MIKEFEAPLGYQLMDWHPNGGRLLIRRLDPSDDSWYVLANFNRASGEITDIGREPSSITGRTDSFSPDGQQLTRTQHKASSNHVYDYDLGFSNTDFSNFTFLVGYPGGDVDWGMNQDPAPGPPPDEENRPPVARDDRWRVEPGLTVEGSVLRNDHDPDGNRISARLIEISFAGGEWSGLERSGAFLYTAGPRTARELVKRITYVAYDSKGLVSKPATATITIARPDRARRSPFASRALPPYARPTWEGPYKGWATLCFGGGTDTSCFTMLSRRRTVELRRADPWSTIQTARRACARFGLLPMPHEECATALHRRRSAAVLDERVIRDAARSRDCLVFQVERKASPRHPLAGTWATVPVYGGALSTVEPYTGRPRSSGFATWTKGVPGTRQVPLFCDAAGRVFRRVNQPLSAR